MPGRLLLSACAVLLLLGVQGALAANPAPARPPSIRMAIPIDAASPGVWSEVVAGAPLVGIIILNPSDGPGQGVDANYAQLVKKAHAGGIEVLGYVYTRWANGQVSVKQAEGLVDQYYSWYHVDGIMLDEANDTCDAAPPLFYGTLYNYVKAKPGPATVLLNPGEAAGECYASMSDVLLTFENDYAGYLGRYAGANWTENVPSSRFFHIVFDVPTVAGMRDVVSMAVARGAGWVYVTNLNNSKGNPYSSLPSYFSQEIAYLGTLDEPISPFPAAMPIIVILGLAAAGSMLVVVGGRRKISD